MSERFSFPLGFDAPPTERQKPAVDLKKEAAIRRLDRLARFLDSDFSVFGIRFGLDPIVGLIPVLGDVIMTVAAVYIVIEAAMLGVRTQVIAMMLVNVLIDFLLGAIPIAGEVFDVFYRANNRNIRLLKKELLKDV